MVDVDIAEDGDPQPPESHALGGSVHDAATRAEINALVSDAALESEQGAQGRVDNHTATEVHDEPQPPAGKGVAGGVAELDDTGTLRSAQVPNLAVTDTFTVTNEADLTGLDAQVGDVGIVTSDSTSFILTGDPAQLSNWTQFETPPAPVQDVFGRTGSVSPSNGDYSASQITNFNSTAADAAPVQSVNGNTGSVSVSSGGAPIFGVGSAGSITHSENTTESGIIQASTYTVEAGVTISIGSPGILIVHARDSIEINGNIDGFGVGGNAGSGGGGDGGAGGGGFIANGGNGGSGSDASFNVGGGGGNAQYTLPENENKLTLPFQFGLFPDIYDTLPAGGAGGGGGGGGEDVSNGGGGGNGGGAVVLLSPQITLSGEFDLRGGDGDPGGGGGEGGGGGGGGGGGFLYTVGGLSDNSTKLLSGGAGGTGGGGAFGGGDGGNGGSGQFVQIPI